MSEATTKNKLPGIMEICNEIFFFSFVTPCQSKILIKSYWFTELLWNTFFVNHIHLFSKNKKVLTLRISDTHAATRSTIKAHDCWIKCECQWHVSITSRLLTFFCALAELLWFAWHARHVSQKWCFFLSFSQYSEGHTKRRRACVINSKLYLFITFQRR